MLAIPPRSHLPLNDEALAAGEARLLEFISEQLADFGGDMEIAEGCWTLLAVPCHDDDTTLLLADY